MSATYEKLLSMGAKEDEAPSDREAGFVTASVVDPFGNILGVMYNPHYLAIVGGDEAPGALLEKKSVSVSIQDAPRSTQG
ncbi:VOC family protein [Qaidamihabitans albus]|uniref:VOC family protein n=1 Tax=Qaidamihabitans albus TaxID=2795733 RepID=UPI0018F1927D|nr:hypothetical protein [Qaidamihabitans albus]